MKIDSYFDATLPFDPPTLENFSALGGVDILFDTAGNRLATPEVREGVDVVAPDDVNTTFFGVDIPQDADTLPNFRGTSAAAPHVAGLAALLLQADPSLTPAGIESVLEQSAIDMDNPFTAGFDVGFDDATGYGFVDALGAIGIVQNMPQLVGLDPNEYLVVNDNRDLLDQNGAANVIDVDLVMPGEQISLRAAIINANAGGTETTLLVQENIYNLTLTDMLEPGNGVNGVVNDLDITGDVTIVGAGAGLTVIDASGLSTDATGVGASDRLFQVGSFGAPASLQLSRLTLTGGNNDLQSANGGPDGGAILVRGASTLELDQVAVVDNVTDQIGGAIYVDSSGAELSIRRSVFTGNEGQFGGAVYVHPGATLTIGASLFANNTLSANGLSPNIRGNNATLINEGYNLTDDNSSDGNSSAVFDATVDDYIATPGDVDFVVTTVEDTLDQTNNNLALSLREAVTLSNTNGAGETWLPAWRLALNRTGMEFNNASRNDLDITGDITIVGSGPGLTLIDTTGLGDDALGPDDRAFELAANAAAQLDVSRVSIARAIVGSNTMAGTGLGGAIRANSFSTVNLDQVALVNNTADHVGGAIHVDDFATLNVTRSVFTNNRARFGGAIYLDSNATLTIGTSVFANNDADVLNPNIRGNNATVTSQGYNLSDDDSSDINSTAIFTGIGDYVASSGAVDYVVTSITDSFSQLDNDAALSLREAVDLANTNDDVAEEIWLPAWDFVLTRDRATYGGGSLTDMDVAFGDLDISDSLTIRGVAGESSVVWRAGVVDAIFDLLGDYNGDGINTADDGNVNFGDFLTWQQQFGSGTTGVTLEQFSADGDDDGDVDGDDLDILWAHLGNTLDLINVL